MKILREGKGDIKRRVFDYSKGGECGRERENTFGRRKESGEVRKKKGKFFLKGKASTATHRRRERAWLKAERVKLGT